MPVWYRPVPGQPLFHVIYSGHITLNDVLGFFDTFEMDFRRHPDFDELCDVGQVTTIDFEDRDVQSLFALVVGIYRRNACRKRIAFVGGNDSVRPVLDQMIRRFDIDYPNVRGRLFDTPEQAHDYLGLPAAFVPTKGLH
ncbi:hypothetical protein [uncultured Tateyamaria sp.]|uniref:hypothetical protein n=1 Tax=uncultured Tateyamaria sp. TaxID=455651 RepID=UPI002624FBB9|nr:hypothetical protein [uncultured Tateyamaria sp.]